MQPNFSDFANQYKSNNHIQNFLNDIKERELSRNPNANANDFINTFMISFPLDLLKDYHTWLTANYSLVPKDD